MVEPPSAAMRAAAAECARWIWLGFEQSGQTMTGYDLERLEAGFLQVISRHCSAPADAGVRRAVPILDAAARSMSQGQARQNVECAASLLRDAIAAGDAGMCDQDFANLTTLRGWGWDVAVHNDYRIDGKRRTFWLFTHPDGRWIKGEGETDADALYQCYRTASPPPAARP